MYQKLKRKWNRYLGSLPNWFEHCLQKGRPGKNKEETKRSTPYSTAELLILIG